MVSLDVVSLFTSVPLEYTINVILDKVYKDKKIQTRLTRAELKNLLELSTREMHFSFNNNIYKQIDGVAMGSPLGPVIANIFMVHLEEEVIPRLTGEVSSWFRYVDDTFTFIKEDKIELVQQTLNEFHQDISFTYEVEENKKISFLDVLVTRKTDGSFDTEVYRKKTDTNIYIHWEAYATKSWKVGTLKGLFRRAFYICSTEEAREKELLHLKNVFIKINGYPSRVVHQVLHEVKEDERRKKNAPQHQEEHTEEEDNTVKPYICLPFRGLDGEKVLRRFRDDISKILPKEIRPRLIYKGTKIGSYFQVKDKVKTEHQTDLVYGYKPSGRSLKEGYIGETHVRFGARRKQHIRDDKGSSLYKFFKEKRIEAAEDDFIILEKGYSRHLDRMIAESLFIKDHHPVLNEQKTSYKLNLFN